MKSIAVVQHVANDGPGFFGSWLQQAHIPFEVFRMFEGCALPHSIADHSGLCMLGGPMSANDPLPYFPGLLNQVREAIALDIPVIGHCLGAQHLATSAHCANQAFLVGSMHLGMQFHCEVDEDKVRDWLETGEAEIRGSNSPGVRQVADILPTLQVDLARSQAIASHIYRRWSQGLRY